MNPSVINQVGENSDTVVLFKHHYSFSIITHYIKWIVFISIVSKCINRVNFKNNIVIIIVASCNACGLAELWSN